MSLGGAKTWNRLSGPGLVIELNVGAFRWPISHYKNLCMGAELFFIRRL